LGSVKAERSGVLVGSIAALAAVYFGAAKLGLELAFATPSVTAIWPPTGIALAALVLGGRRLWPGVALGAFLANVTTDVPVYTALGITVGNTLEAIVGAWLLERFRINPALRSVRDILGLVVLAGVVSTTIAATIGVASLALGDELTEGAGSVWRVWWLGDMGGDLLVAPFLLVAFTHWPYREVLGHPLEAVATLGALIAVSLVAFGGEAALAYLVFPLLIWIAYRFWQPGAATAALVVGVIAVAFTANEQGQFVEASEDDSLLLAQTFAGVTGLTALLMAVITSERTRAQRATRAVAHTLQAGLLPSRLAMIPGMETAAWHRAGSATQEVGGDFYDVFETGPGAWMAVVGDVCGKGPEAASATALARHTLRAVGKEQVAPSEALRRLNEAVIDADLECEFITVLCARVATNGHGHGHEITVSNGGHPPPLLVHAGGEVTEVGVAGTLLGVLPDPALTDERIELAPGESLALFTDGLFERKAPQGHDSGIWLRAALRRASGAGASEIVEQVEQEVAAREGPIHDDRVLLVLRSALASDGGPKA
jgi:integral membrane sensor domain MASE1/serine phosphatase RsbU (regulator of sigma subunit)